MMKIQVKIAEIQDAIQGSEALGLDYIEIIANAIPVPEGWKMVPNQDSLPILNLQPEVPDEN